MTTFYKSLQICEDFASKIQIAFKDHNLRLTEVKYMTAIYKSIAETIALIIIFIFFSTTFFAQTEVGNLRGIVVDEANSFIVGAKVSLTNQNETFKKTTVTNDKGYYEFNSLVQGEYILTISADGFEKYENRKININSQKVANLEIKLKVKQITVDVSVGENSDLNTDTNNNLDALVLKEAEIASLPDDEESLTDMLRALAGPSVGQNGVQIIVDGFTGGEVPSKDTIREIRINQNPFSSEFANLGHGRIQIFTKPGTGRFHTEAAFYFSDESLNSRSPFADRKVSDQSRNLRAFISDSPIEKKLSYGLSFSRYANDANKVIKATTLDSAFNRLNINQTFPSPNRSLSIRPRIDYQINENHTLTARYNLSKSENNNSGVGDFSLPSRAFDSNTTRQTFRLTETAIINESLVNETRFQFINIGTEQNGINDSPTLNVFGAFNGGGSSVGESFNRQNRWEFANVSTWSWGNHAIRAGGLLRGMNLDSISPQNFNGTYSFAGGTAPQLDANNEIVLDGSGQPILVSIDSLERYRRTLLLRQNGFTPEEIRNRGGGATQFSIAAGNPQAKVNQIDFGGFVQDDWRVRSNFTLGLGLRYEAQTNVSNNLNFAPRIGFAWSPKFGKKESNSKMVIRGGFGIFFDRIGENLTLQANRFDGVNQQRFIVSDPLILNNFPNIPSVSTLQSFSIPQTERRLADDIRSPYTLQSSISLERQLPLKINFVATFINTRSQNMLRSLSLNAPLSGNIYQYESSGMNNQKQLIFNMRRSSKLLFWAASYTYNKAKSDTDGANSFPVNSYDISNEFGRSAFDIRHRFTFRSSINLPSNMYISTFISAATGVPFNITTGRDTNGDSIFNERPAFATDLTRSSVVRTEFGDFDVEPLSNQTIIPRNFGSSPSFFSVNLSLYKTIGIGPILKNTKGKHTHRGDTKKAYNVTFGIRANNIFNNVNLASPVGNLSSPLFGQSTSTLNGFGFSSQRGASTNRRLSLSLRFSF